MKFGYIPQPNCLTRGDQRMGGIEKLDPALLHSQIQVFAKLLHAIETMDAGQLNGAEGYSTTTGFSPTGMRETLPVATSICAVVITLCARSTRGMQPRISCAARRPETTTNSNGFVPCGR
jgi:hypothetical protein